MENKIFLFFDIIALINLGLSVYLTITLFSPFTLILLITSLIIGFFFLAIFIQMKKESSNVKEKK